MTGTSRIRGGLVLTALLLAAAEGQVNEGAKLGSFRVPTYDENGVKKSELIGESATVVNGIAEITNVQLAFYRSDGTNLQMRVTAPRCRYKQANGVAESESSVRIEGDKIVVTGDGFAWDGNKEVFKIFRNSRVVLRDVRRQVDQDGGSNDQGE